jgi:hypothetical protein
MALEKGPRIHQQRAFSHGEKPTAHSSFSPGMDQVQFGPGPLGPSGLLSRWIMSPIS